MKTKKQIKIKKASNFVFHILRIILVPFMRFKYNYRFRLLRKKELQRPCLILSNHQTIFDQFALAAIFPFAVNFVASDTLFRHGLGSILMMKLARPIPITKGIPDMLAVRHMLRVIKDGGAVAIFPSGNRSVFGEESTIDDSIGKLAKKMNVPLVLVQLKGGYATKPRWMRKGKTNRGKMVGSVVRIISTKELNAMSNEEVSRIIHENIAINEYDFLEKHQIKYKGRHKAEYLESVLFYCPHCHSFNTLSSKGNSLTCHHCNTISTIDDYGCFIRETDSSLPRTIKEWGDLQLEHIKTYDYSSFQNQAIFADNNICFSRAERAKKEYHLGTGKIELYNNRFVVLNTTFLITDINDLALGVNKLNVYTKEGTFALVCKETQSLFKYMVLIYHLKNILNKTDYPYYGY